LQHPLAADIRPESRELQRLNSIQWHALLRRLVLLLNTAQWGVKYTKELFAGKESRWRGLVRFDHRGRCQSRK
jgi:hypothetical protein